MNCHIYYIYLAITIFIWYSLWYNIGMVKVKKSNMAYKYRIYPNEAQITMFAKTFGCCRKVWNLMLADREKAYQQRKESIHPTPAQYKKEYPFLKEVDSLALANVQINQNKAFTEFFHSIKKKGKYRGYPKYKSRKKSNKSYTTNNQDGTIEVGSNYIKLPKVGKVKATIHRQANLLWKLKSATISQNSDGTYYCSILYEYDNIIQSVKPNLDKAIGLDYKSDGLYVDSNGHQPEENKPYRKSQKKLCKLQRRLSRKVGSKKGQTKSNNYLKQQKKVNKLHRHIANQRNDYLHKRSTEIANQHDVVCVEDLNMKAMSNKGFHNGKATMDNGYGMFLTMLEYKLLNRGKYFIKVDKFFPSSQMCYECGQVHSKMKDLSVRHIYCDCGYNNDRDINAALNIKREGLRQLGIL